MKDGRKVAETAEQRVSQKVASMVAMKVEMKVLILAAKTAE